MTTARKGWYGGAEKSETFYFEHEWVPVPGHPAEVATCDICGLNRWSDEHVTYDKAALRARTKARLAELRASLQPPLTEETAARLARNYGPRNPLSDVPSPDMPPTAPAASGPSPRDVENQAIAANARTPEAKGPHPFMQAEFPAEDGQLRCRLCGAAEEPHKAFEPEIPIAAQLTAEDKDAISTTLFPGVITYPPVATTTGSFSTVQIIVPPPGNWNTTTTNATWHATERTHEAPVVSEGQSVPLPDERTKAFLTEVNGKTLITGPANVFVRELEKASGANKHFLWMQGRFVGAEKANRNGAFWSTEDLELGQVTVANGPLNWLHEARHVIGTVAKAQLVTREEAADQDLSQPYIQAASVIWRWIYPDEAWVIEQASDAKKLWYSMECISERVSCVGDGSCGAEVSYAEYLQGIGATCAHMTQRTASRRFADPTFLGGAVIVPPVRPGWAEADATVMKQAASMAEKAFDQAGHPDMTASEWEQLMAGVIRYATT